MIFLEFSFQDIFPLYNTLHNKNICIHISLHKGKIWNARKIYIVGRSVFLTCCFVKDNNVMEDSISLFSSTLCYLYKYLINQPSYTQVPFHQTKLLVWSITKTVSILSAVLSMDLFRIPDYSPFIQSRARAYSHLAALQFRSN